MSGCGCRIDVHDDGIDEIVHCPTHAAAPAMKEEGEAFLSAVEALCDWMNGNDMSADHEAERPEDFKRLCDRMVSFRAALRQATEG